MSLEHLWAGWRAAYVGSGSLADGPEEGGVMTAGEPSGLASSDGAELDESCVFCAIVSSPAPDEDRYVVWSNETMIAILNAFPYTTGHLMVMPRRHVRDLDDLTPEEAARLWEAVHESVTAVRGAYHPDGLNLGLNLGRAAGAGIPAHLHVHVVPRWIGDTNFMTATAGVRVLPEALPVSWKRLRAAWVS
ncbi:MAG TPA: HIT domain-containing protein [Acidimicrobiales bacterium]|nr:HIT domain-containing protein [Acidimicrobiales bacterium]